MEDRGPVMIAAGDEWRTQSPRTARSLSVGSAHPVEAVAHQQRPLGTGHIAAERHELGILGGQGLFVSGDGEVG